MNIGRTRAFVLRTYQYGEADRIVVFFAEEIGLLRGIAKGSRKLKSRVGGALEPLTLVDLRYVEKAGRELVVVTGCEAIRSLYSVSADVEVAAAVGLIAELTAEFNADRDPNPAQFRLLDLAQRALLAAIDAKLVAHYVELFTLKLAGLLPSPESLRSESTGELMKTLLRTNLIEEPLPEIEPRALAELGRFLRNRVTGSLGKQLKAYGFLDEIRSSKENLEAGEAEDKPTE
jgi:recombinational DNA repair protein (RecF pathway)